MVPSKENCTSGFQTLDLEIACPRTVTTKQNTKHKTQNTKHKTQNTKPNTMLSFKSPAYRLSGKDLFNILKNCKLCFKITNNGKNIIDFNNLKSIILPKTKKNAIILYAYQHWMLLLTFKSQCVLIDPLNEVHVSHPDVIHAIITFCIDNSLMLHSFDTKFQKLTTNVCGFLVLWALLKSTKLSFSNFMKLKRIILCNTVSTNERGMVNTVKRHFHI